MASCWVALLTLALLFPAPALNTDDQESIQGTWKVVSAADSGRKTPAAVLKNLKLVITKDKITYMFGKKRTEWSYQLEVTTTPKWIDLRDGDGTNLGIYELEADNLRICFPEGRPGERSTAFESKPNSVNDVLIVLRRERPSAE